MFNTKKNLKRSNIATESKKLRNNKTKLKLAGFFFVNDTVPVKEFSRTLGINLQYTKGSINIRN